MFPKFNLRLVGVLIILVIIAVTYITDQKYYNDTIRSVLEWKHLNISIWFGCFICFVLHYLSARARMPSMQGLYISNLVFLLIQLLLQLLMVWR